MLCGAIVSPQQLYASPRLSIVISLCINNTYPNLPDATQIVAAGFNKLAAIPAHPSGSWNSADQGWPNIFGKEGVRLRFREETRDVNGEKFQGFVCEINETNAGIEELRKEMFTVFSEPQSSVVGDGYAEYYWSISGVSNDRQEVVIDTLSNSLTYYSFKKQN
jgi:hypothetical protein